jgi:uncharacterized protein YndB with AHSA1/START domain
MGSQEAAHWVRHGKKEAVMDTIRHRVGVQAPVERVQERLTTLDGLASWWTRDVEGDPAEGGKLTFSFGIGRTVEVEVLSVLPEQVVWRCVGGPDEWIDANFSFDLAAGTDGETVVLFQHTGWREPVEFMSHCSTKWGYFLLSLKLAVETSAGTPWPDHTPICGGDD